MRHLKDSVHIFDKVWLIHHKWLISCRTHANGGWSS